MTDGVVKDTHATTQEPSKLVKVSHISVPGPKHVIQGASEEACRNMKIRNEWLAATHVNQDAGTVTSKSIKSSTEREKFFMDKNSSKESESIKTAASRDGSSVINITEQNENISVSVDQNNEIISSKNSLEPTTNNLNSRINLKSPSEKTGSFMNGAVKTLDNESLKFELENDSKGSNLSTTRHSPHALGTVKLSRDKCNNEEIISTHGQDFEIKNGNYDESVQYFDSNQSKNTEEKTLINEKNLEIPRHSKVDVNNSEGPVPNGAVITNGWPDIKDYTVEQKENIQNVEGKMKLELNASISCEENLSLEIHEKKDSAKDNKAPSEILVKQKKDSKVSKFVRMFNRKETPAAEGRERSSIKRHPSRVWGMCLQVQSPNAEEENDVDSGSKWTERDSIKSEPLIDNDFSEIKSSSDLETERGKTSSSYSNIEEAGHHSLDFITCDSSNEKKKNLKLDDKKNRNLIRNIGGRRSFDRPQRMAKILTKRSNTLDDVDSSSIFSRSSKTLPASPTSEISGSEQDSNVSHPFYRKFYSHCMILPMRKRKKEMDKKFVEYKSPNIVIDTSPQSTAVIWQNEEGCSNDVNGDSQEVHATAVPTKSEEEPNDSPRKLPVIDDLLAEIMENVTLMELDMKEDEKQLSFHSPVEDGLCPEPGDDHSVTHNTETQSGIRIQKESLRDIGDSSRNEGATADQSDSWVGKDSSDFTDITAHTSGIKISRSSSRVGSLISKFEQGDS